MTVTHCSCDRGCPIFLTWWVDSSHVASAKVSSVEWHRNRSHCLACVHQGTLMTARRDQKQIKLLNKLYVTEVKKAKVRILESCEIWEQQMEPNSLGLLVKGFTCSLVFCLKKNKNKNKPSYINFIPGVYMILKSKTKTEESASSIVHG